MLCLKTCPFCHSLNTVKNGKKQHQQQYYCKSCHRQFIGKPRLSNDQLWLDYTEGKQTYRQLALKYNLSIRTIQRRLDRVDIAHSYSQVSLPSVTNIIMDTTYFGRDFGVMVFMDNQTGKVLLYRFVHHETNALYRQGIQSLQAQGMVIHSITCDGRRGLLGGFDTILTQMCQFHQQQIIRRYVTKNPKHPAAKELFALCQTLTQCDAKQFKQALDTWLMHHCDYLNERSVSEDGARSWYTHKRLRSAYRSLVNHLPYLFVYHNHPKQIANTTNKLEGLFSDLKQKLRNHQGLNKTRKQRFIESYLKSHQLHE